MARDMKISDETADVQGDATAALYNGGYLRIYESGVAGIPATANTALTTQTLLAEPRFANPAIASSMNGVLTANPMIADSSANASATTGANFYRTFRSDGTTVISQGTVGAVGSSSDCELNSVMIAAGAEVSVTSFTHTIPKSA